MRRADSPGASGTPADRHRAQRPAGAETRGRTAGPRRRVVRVVVGLHRRVVRGVVGRPHSLVRGAGRTGIPAEPGVDPWGIRVEELRPGIRVEAYLLRMWAARTKLMTY